MAALSTTNRGAVRASTRPRAGTVVVQVGDALLTMTPAEARELAEHLAAGADAIDEGATDSVTFARRKPLEHQQAATA
ncbi:hypothetical protein [Stenotrophomonas lactitubi]|uniref:hypothetical protein n=1 Tax=Stenotrophomonas lactitubi TaxID=2045214 RepID=UPI001D5E7A73|nr:hypothetical protein [Stenotrophomonas lactitubi]CAH0175226.1 hypothetical protein SRABI81_01323 [Stenotrophomonas lactitubi]CAH0175534.1 hypothetical protein SRABI122_01291 [Stenotrophomonas lactitubi]CAH0193662.1 hypothetical protein SRABI102_01580 [Stenotrophomonas lactitubi]CAH0228147.1 hypothetical protein SRABI66_02619 [Stenotrophomonas lactitubi]